MMQRAYLVGLMALLPACFEADLTKGTTACESDGSCPLGRTCHLGRCMTTGAGPDAGPGAGQDAGQNIAPDAGPAPQGDAGPTPDTGINSTETLAYAGCLDLLEEHPRTPSGWYSFDVDGEGSRDLTAYCDMDYLGGGWTELFHWADELTADSPQLAVWPAHTTMQALVHDDLYGQLLIAFRDDNETVRLDGNPTVLSMPRPWIETNPFSQGMQLLVVDNIGTRLSWGNTGSGEQCTTYWGDPNAGLVRGKVCLENSLAPAFLNWAGVRPDCCPFSNTSAGVFSGSTSCPPPSLCTTNRAYSLAIRASRGGQDQPPYRDCAQQSAFEPTAQRDGPLTLDPDGPLGTVGGRDYLCKVDLAGGPSWTLVYKRHEGFASGTLCQNQSSGASPHRLYETNLSGTEFTCAASAMMDRHRELRCTFRADPASVVVEYTITSPTHTVSDVLQLASPGGIGSDGNAINYSCTINNVDGIVPRDQGAAASILPCRTEIGAEYALFTTGVGHFATQDADHSGHCFSR